MSENQYIDLTWPGQYELLQDYSFPEHCVVTGVGYGKTHCGVRWHHNRCEVNNKSKLSGIIAPRYDLIKESIIPLYEEYFDSLNWKQGRHYRINRSNYPFIDYRKSGHRVLLRSVDKTSVKKLVSYTFSHAWIDECGLCPPTTPIEVAKRVRCKNAVALQRLNTGTPEGVGWFSKAFGGQVCSPINDRFSVGPGKLVLHGKTYDNTTLPQQYLDELYAQFSWNQNLVLAYIEGLFVPIYEFRGYDYDPNKHMSSNVEPDAERPIYLCWDFNVTQGRSLKGVSWVALQENRGDVLCPDENKGSSRVTAEAVESFKQQFPIEKYRWTEIIVTGDANGHHRDTRGYDDDYTIIETMLREAGYQAITMDAPEANPSQGLRITAMNRLMSDDFTSILLLSERCIKLADSLLQTTITKTGKIEKAAGETHTDYSDACGYGVTKLCPVIKPRTPQRKTGSPWG